MNVFWYSLHYSFVLVACELIIGVRFGLFENLFTIGSSHPMNGRSEL